MNTGNQHFFGGGGESALQPVTAVLMILTTILLFFLPRRYAFIPLIVSITIIPLNQQIVAGGIHLTMSRVLILLGWSRLLGMNLRGGIVPGRKWNRIDVVFALYCVSSVITYVILWDFDTSAIINRLGFLYNALGMYWLIRCLIRDDDDTYCAMKTLVWLFVVIGVVMINQQLMSTNIFSSLGEVPDSSDIRDGRIRSQGPFVHPLTAGAIGSALLPLAVGLWWVNKGYKKSRLGAVAGVVSFIAVGVTSSSSTALITLVAGMVGMLFWRFRKRMAEIRWVALLVLVALHLVMKAPVWALIARIDLTGSSSGYHRFQLIDQFIKRFSEWWLVGTQSTMDWGWDMWDTINTYVTAGTSGGLVTFLLFVTLLAVAFQQLGKKRKSDPRRAPLLWILGSMLFAHTVAFFGIEYFDQTQFVWYTSLALISAAVSLPALDQKDAAASAAADRTQGVAGCLELTHVWQQADVHKPQVFLN